MAFNVTPIAKRHDGENETLHPTWKEPKMVRYLKSTPTGPVVESFWTIWLRAIGVFAIISVLIGGFVGVSMLLNIILLFGIVFAVCGFYFGVMRLASYRQVVLFSDAIVREPRSEIFDVDESKEVFRFADVSSVRLCRVAHKGNEIVVMELINRKNVPKWIGVSPNIEIADLMDYFQRNSVAISDQLAPS